MWENAVTELNDVIRRILRQITNPALNANQRLKLATKWYQLVCLVADKWQLTPEGVQDIIEKYEDKTPITTFEPPTYKNDEERIFWEFLLEAELLEDQEKR
jgi:hypothetical protein